MLFQARVGDASDDWDETGVDLGLHDLLKDDSRNGRTEEGLEGFDDVCEGYGTCA